MAYNMSFTDGAINLFTTFEGINTLYPGITLLLLFTVWIVSFAAFYKYGGGKDFVISSFLTTIVSFLLFFLGVIAWGYALIPLILFIGSLLVYWFN